MLDVLKIEGMVNLNRTRSWRASNNGNQTFTMSFRKIVLYKSDTSRKALLSFDIQIGYG